MSCFTQQMEHSLQQPRVILSRRRRILVFEILHFVQDDIRNVSLFLTVVIISSLLLTACGEKSPPVSESEVRAVFEKTIPSNLDDKAWAQIPVHHAKLRLQDMVEPRLMQASTGIVDVQSVTDGQKIIFRLEWNDPTLDDVPGPGRFGDAVAVQLPAAPTPDIPAPQMGENGKPVEITYWSAIFQAMVNGRKDDI